MQRESLEIFIASLNMASVHWKKSRMCETGLPRMKWKEDPKWRIDRYIEVQVWDDRPIWEFFSQTGI